MNKILKTPLNPKAILLLTFYFLLLFSCSGNNDKEYICEINQNRLVLPEAEVSLRFPKKYGDMRRGLYAATLTKKHSINQGGILIDVYTFYVHGRFIELKEHELLFLKD